MTPLVRTWLLICLALWAGAAAPAATTTAADPVAVGRAIYLQGQLPNGAPLRGTRFGSTVSGQTAACVLCHRRSGMGSVEGDELVAPITGNALFMNNGQVVATMDPVRGKLMSQDHEPYTDASFAQAVRKGIHPSGRAMNELMPHYKLGDEELLALSAYLRTLSAEWSPGVEERKVHLATVVTPGVDEARRKAFVDTLKATISQKNGSTAPGRRHMVSAAEFTMKTERNWDLQVWQLKGAPETWAEQLDGFYRDNPVFAIVSGLSESTWVPVQDFCERQKVPCWFPSVPAVPDSAAGSTYSLYFSRGVGLEAAALGAHLKHLAKASRPQRLVQVLGHGAASASAALAMKQALAGTGIKLETRPLQADAAQPMAQALSGLGPRDAVVLWLQPDEVKLLDGVEPPAARVYVSGVLAGAERAPLNAAWKSVARMVYPYELPQKRGSNLAYFRTWINLRQIPLIDEPMQSEVYFASVYLSDTLAEMLNNVYRDYLIERAENMLSRREGRKAEEETHERQTIRSRYVDMLMAAKAPASGAQGNRAVVTAEDNLGKRTGTTVYPALGLGPGQRFASKGAYIVRFVSAADNAIAAESAWIVP